MKESKNIIKYLLENFLYVIQGIPKFPGVNNREFRIKLDKVIEPSSILIYDVFFGVQLIVLSNTGLIHKVKLRGRPNSEKEYFPKEKLKKGTDFIAIKFNPKRGEFYTGSAGSQYEKEKYCKIV